MSNSVLTKNSTINHFELAEEAERKADYVSAVLHFTVALKIHDTAKGPVLDKLLKAYHTLGGELHKNAKLLNSSDGVIHSSGFTMNASEVERIAKTIHKKDLDDLIEKTNLLANSDLLDPAFVGKQIGKQTSCPFEAAFDYYTHFHQRLQPNVYFSPLFYSAINELEAGEEPVYHYLTHDKEGLQFHRLFDREWLASIDPSIQETHCPISYYWKNCYTKGITACDPSKVTIDNRVQQLFFYETSIPSLSSYDGIEQIRRKLQTATGIDSQTLSQLNAITEFFHGNKSLPHFIPIDFNSEDYVDLHKDMMLKYQNNPFDSLSHYLLHGIFEERPYSLQERFSYRVSKKRAFDTSQLEDFKEKKPLCVLMHLYYVDLWPVLRSYIDNIDVEFDLHINMVDSTWTSEAVCLIRKDYPNAVIKISPNEGRDIGGYFNLLKTIEIDDYLAVVTMHSKKSQHISERMLVTWRTNLLQAILGSKETVKNNLAAFISDPTVGIIGSALHREDAIGQNAEGYEQLLDLYQISENNRDCEYVSGTMMMLRSDIMKRIYEVAKNLSFNNADNKGLDFLVDGQLEHALERVFGNVMKELGYKFYWG